MSILPAAAPDRGFDAPYGAASPGGGVAGGVLGGGVYVAARGREAVETTAPRTVRATQMPAAGLVAAFSPPLATDAPQAPRASAAPAVMLAMNTALVLMARRSLLTSWQTPRLTSAKAAPGTCAHPREALCAGGITRESARSSAPPRPGPEAVQRSHACEAIEPRRPLRPRCRGNGGLLPAGPRVQRLPMGFPGAVFMRAPGSTNDHDLGLFSVGSSAGPSSAGRQSVGLYHLAWEVRHAL